MNLPLEVWATLIALVLITGVLAFVVIRSISIQKKYEKLISYLDKEIERLEKELNKYES